MDLNSRWRGHCEHAGEVAIALWFHAAVHDPRSASNELHSAAWGARSLIRAGADSDTAQRVHDLVMAARHEAPAVQKSTCDAQLLVDIDLAILGSPPERFEQYDQDLRKEYSWMPGFRYRDQRAQVLQAWLDRPRIYHGEAAAALFNVQARINLTAALSRLAL